MVGLFRGQEGLANRGLGDLVAQLRTAVLAMSVLLSTHPEGFHPVTGA
jgi:hypothetical protein